jgi:hypothetical protein
MSDRKPRTLRLFSDLPNMRKLYNAVFICRVNVYTEGKCSKMMEIDVGNRQTLAQNINTTICTSLMRINDQADNANVVKCN